MTQLLDAPPSSALSADPRFESVPAFAESLGEDATQFAADAGLCLDPWQRRVMAGAMGLLPGGKWSARQIGLLVPRQNGKGSLLEARELYAMFVGDERLIIHSAHRYDTSQDHFRRILELIEGNPDLDRYVQSVSKVIGKESITLKSRSQLKFKARTLSGSGRGFSCDLLVLDEAFLLPEQALSAMLPTLAARPNPQTWFTSSSGMPDSHALWRLVKRGRAGGDGLAYWEWGLPSGVDPADRDLWRVANPGRVSMEILADDFDLMTPEDFAREHLGVWDEMTSDTVIPMELWGALADMSVDPPRPVSRVAFAVDTSPSRGRTSISVAGGRPDGVPQVQTVQTGDGAGWVVPRLVELVAAHPSFGVVVDMQSAAASLVDELVAAHVEVIEMNTADAKQAFGQFYDRCMDGSVRHLGQEGLDAALRGAKDRLVGDAKLWDRKTADVDITPLVSATNALWGWTSRRGTGELQIF